MASLATENSIASVPLSYLAQLQDDLITKANAHAPAPAVDASRARASSTVATLANPPQDSSGSDSHAQIEARAGSERPLSSLVNGDVRRPSSSITMVAPPPPATPSHAPSQDGFAAMNYPSSSLRGFRGGDTQPLESQVYRDFRKSIIITPKKPGVSGAGAQQEQELEERQSDSGTLDTTFVDKTPKTCQEGDTGYVDLFDGFQPSPIPPFQFGNGAFTQDLLVQSPPTEPRPGFSAKVLSRSIDLPETPATVAGRKRGHDGQPLNTSATTATKTTTPGISRFFPAGPQVDVLSATQLFQQTQAPSSPPPNGPLSDPIVTRPSPNLIHQFSVSSPVIPTSSPVAPMHALRSSNTAEPRESYTSMRESQEQRAAQLRKQLELQRRLGGRDEVDDEDDGFEDYEIDDEVSMRQRAQRPRSRRVWSDHALDRISRPRPPTSSSRPSSARGRPGSATIDLVTSPFLAVGRGEKIEFEIDEDGEEDEADILLEGQEHEGRDEADGPAQEGEDDEYDELRQIVLRSQGFDDHDRPSEDDEVRSGDEYDDDTHVGVEEEDTNRHEENDAILAGTPDGYLSRGSQPSRATQHTTVADSQPERRECGRFVSLSQQLPMPQRSSVPSFVPGSQYTGRTSQDQARHSRDKMEQLASQRASMASREASRVPSSPPVVAMTDDDLPVATRNVQLLHTSAPLDDTSTPNILEVPESDIVAPTKTTSSKPSAENDDQNETNTNNATYFATAPTHLSAPSTTTASPLKKFSLSQQSKTGHNSASQSPRRAVGARRFAEINGAYDANETNGVSGSQVDIDAVLGDVITSQDRVHMAAMSSPPLEGMEMIAAQDQQPQIFRSRGLKRRRLMRVSTAKDTSERDDVFTFKDHQPLNERGSEGGRKKQKVDKPEEAVTKTSPNREAPPQALRNSPSKANEMPASTPVEKISSQAETPQSVRVREKAGAKAASQALSRRKSIERKGRRTKVPPSEERKNIGGKAAGKVVKKHKKSGGRVARTVQDVVGLQENNVEATTAEKTADYPQTSAEPITASEQILEKDGHEAIAVENELPIPDRTHTADNEPLHDEQQDQQPQPAAGTVSRPRIFAIFRGTGGSNFYPATWLASSRDGKGHRVQFDDSTVTDVDAHLCCNLDLQLDDTIKIDFLGHRGKYYLVKGYGEVESALSKGIDMHGHRIVKVQVKPKQGSTGGGQANAVQSASEVVDIEVDRVYLPPSMWGHFKDRIFVPPSQPNVDPSRPGTPASWLQAQEMVTPRSRTRHSFPVGTKPLLQHRREGSVTSLSATGGETGLFANMAFAISYADHEAEKAEVTRLIARNGGRILEHGFDELFDLPDLDSDESADSAPTSDPQHEPSNLSLTPEAQTLGFVALIGDTHSRRAKYVQALALGLPTLSGRWILDSLCPSHNPSLSTPDPAPLANWSKYLLPAGESAYLSGAVRSRSIVPYIPRDASLSTTINSRPRLLAEYSGVLIVVPKKNRAVALLNRKKAYAFLTLALGAAKVRRVVDLHEAKSLLRHSLCSAGESGLDGESKDGALSLWKWVYVDGDVDEARKVLFAGSSENSAKGKGRAPQVGKNGGKRKSGSGTLSDGLETTVKVVDDEFVVQSLILGDLVD